MNELEDVEFIRESRKQIVRLRERPITLIRVVAGDRRDPLTGDYVTEEVRDYAEGTFRRITSGGAGSDDITYVDGVLAEAGDAIINFDISYSLEGVTTVEVDGERWRIRATDEVGLIADNRHYVLVRKVT